MIVTVNRYAGISLGEESPYGLFYSSASKCMDTASKDFILSFIKKIAKTIRNKIDFSMSVPCTGVHVPSNTRPPSKYRIFPGSPCSLTFIDVIMNTLHGLVIKTRGNSITQVCNYLSV